MQSSATESELQALAYWVREHLGFADRGGQAPELRRAVHHAAREAGLTDRELVQAALRDAPSDPQALRLLVPHLTIGETYFFRDTPLFQALEARILPELLAQAGPRPLRIWSAACSTGEEPYSIAMALGRVAPGTRHQIFGTDVNPRAIASARAHTYRPWSLRCLSDHERRQWFTPQGSESWLLDGDVAGRVQFDLHNLLDRQLPLTLQGAPMDAIFCRNVLIYLDIPSAQQVLRQLISHLADGGWLIVAAVETFLVPTPPVELVEVGDALAFRLPPGRRDMPPQWPHLWPPVEPGTVYIPAASNPAAAPLWPGPAVPAPALDPAPTPQAEPPAQPLAPLLAPVDAGHGSDALYAAALRAEAEGDEVAAAAELRKLLFLNPSHVLGHLALAKLQHRQRRTVAALRSERNALILLDNLPPNAPLLDGHGLTAGELLAQLKAAAASCGAP